MKYTVFAPTNAAFADAGYDIDAILAAYTQLTHGWLFEILSRRWPRRHRAHGPGDGGTIEMLSGNTFPVTNDGTNITIDGLPVPPPPTEASNGIIHTLEMRCRRPDIERVVSRACRDRRLAVFDLDRTLITSSSATVFRKHLAEHGLGGGHDLPLVDQFTRFYEQFGETWLLMQPARLASRASAGLEHRDGRAGDAEAAEELATMLLPGAAKAIEEHRAAGRLLVDGDHVAAAVRRTVRRTPRASTPPLPPDGNARTAPTARCSPVGCSGRSCGAGPRPTPSPRGRASTGSTCPRVGPTATATSTRRCWRPSATPSPSIRTAAADHGHDPRLAGHALRSLRRRRQDRSVANSRNGAARSCAREIVAPNARIEFEGIENIPSTGPAIVVFNHRSYFDPTVMALVIAKAGRNVRGLGKKEVFDVPLVGRLMKASGGIRVDRGTGSDEPLDAAIAAVEAGELLMIAPEGTIPRGPAFFDPVLKGRWGAARIAAATGAPVIPVGLWGTEKVWPRSSRLPKLSLTDRPLVTATVGPPVDLKYRSPDADTKKIMKAISALLPAGGPRAPYPDPRGVGADLPARISRRPGGRTRSPPRHRHLTDPTNARPNDSEDTHGRDPRT